MGPRLASVTAMSDADQITMTPEQRVQLFLDEYDTHWRTAQPGFNVPFGVDTRAARTLWTELMKQIQRDHFTATSKVRLNQGFAVMRPMVGAQAEYVASITVRGGTARVQTRSNYGTPTVNEYKLRAEGDDWRIDSIDYSIQAWKEPFVDPSTVNENVSRCSADAPFNEMPVEQAQLDENRNFTEREITRATDDEASRTEITQIGTLVTATGVLTVLDFGNDNDDALPLARTVEPGSYPVDRVTAFGRNAAVRVRFSDETPASWHPASPPDTGHVISVDAGCVCVVDYAGYAGMTERAKERVYDKFTKLEGPAAASEFKVGRKNVGIACESGYGDGGYPAYWGVDSQGRIAQLVIDFLVLASEDDDGALTHL